MADHDRVNDILRQRYRRRAGDIVAKRYPSLNPVVRGAVVGQACDLIDRLGLLRAATVGRVIVDMVEGIADE